MSDQYYIRVRGKVQGPFEADKLRLLARRGQFSRLHEISVDGQQWEPAQERPELFTAPAVAVATASRSDGQAAAWSGTVPESRPVTPAGLSPRGAASSAASEAWYYAHGGKEQGPIDFVTLYEMLARRQLAPETDVWREGMVEWVPANTVPGLVANAVSMSQSPVKETEAAAEIGQGVVRILVESRGWVTFIAVMAFVYAAILLAGGLLVIILGPRLAADTAAGLTQMIFSIVVAVGGWLLMGYASGVERFHRRRDEDSLIAALATLRTLWSYIGIVLIVLLTLGLVGVIMVLSMAGSVSSLLGRFPST